MLGGWLQWIANLIDGGYVSSGAVVRGSSVCVSAARGRVVAVSTARAPSGAVSVVRARVVVG